MRKHLVVLFVVTAASITLAGIAGAQTPEPPDDTSTTSTTSTSTSVPDAPDAPEEEPDDGESTTTVAPTTSTTSTTTTAPPPTTAAPTTAPPAVVAGLQQEGCHPSYQGACVPVSAGDVNCPQIPVKDFQVVGPDVYGLDGDNDGVACEPDSRSSDDGPVTAPAATTTSATPDQLASTGSSSLQRYLLSLALVAAGLFAVLVSAMVVPEIALPRRGGFTVTNISRSGDEIRTRIMGVRSRRGSRR